MRLRGTNRNFRRVSPRVPFNPRKLFRNSEQGVHYDPSDLSTLFQDSAGTTPVTAVEQPVGLMLDKRLGLVLGPDVKNTGATGLIGSATAATYNTVNGTGTASRVDVSNQSFVSFSGLSANVTFRLDISNTGVNSISVRTNSLGGSTAFMVPAGQRVAGFVSAVTSVFIASGVASGAFAFTVHSLSALPGNHTFQPTAIDRPILRNRYNLLTKTEQFDDAVWTKNGVSVTPDFAAAPDGFLTADKIIPTITSTTFKELQQTTTVVGGVTYTFFQYVKADGYRYVQMIGQAAAFGTFSVNYDLVAGVETMFAAGTSTVVKRQIDPVGNGWYRIAVSVVSLLTAVGRMAVNIVPEANSPRGVAWAGDGSSGVLFWGASIVPADQAPLPYQRVNTATDYDSDPSKFPLYLAANGTNTWMQTNNIDFTATDKVTVFAGVRKLSDAARAVVLELGNANLNSFRVEAPLSAGASQYAFASTGSLGASVGPTGYAAPHSAVLSGLGGIASDLCALLVNGAVAAQSTGDQGTGNYGNYPLYLFRRGGTSLPFNGHFYGLVIRGALTSDPDTLKMEKWLSFKTGVQL